MTEDEKYVREQRCTRCGLTKVADEFAAYRRSRSGLHSHCRACQRQYQKEQRAASPDTVRANDRLKSSRKQKTPHTIELRRKRLAEYSARYPEKRDAHAAVRRALDAGQLVRQACERCGSIKSHAHHDDYSKPLEVQWLCPLDHAARHRELKELSA